MSRENSVGRTGVSSAESTQHGGRSTDDREEKQLESKKVLLASDAFVVAPGGIGTLLETAMIWQLLQVKHLDDTPLILIGDMWRGLVDWADANMSSYDPPLAGREDLRIPRCVATADEAIAVLKEHHARWRDRS